MVDLQAALREQIFGIVDSVQPRTKYKILVIDDVVQDIFSHCLETHELLDRSIANVQLIDHKRQTEQYLDAVYIVECSEYAIGCISADFRRQPTRYRAAHVFFLPGGTDIMIQKFRNSFMARYIERVDVAPIRFYPVERQVFTLADPHANDMLYNANLKNEVMPYIDTMGQQIASVCMSLGELPYVRYLDNEVSELPELVAAATDAHLQQLRNRYMTPEKESAPRTTLLIVDRSIDLFAPLMHEFTFQALAYDVLKFKNVDRNEFESADGAVEGRLSEQDPDWTSLRHMHISEVTEKLTTRVRELREANPHFSDPNSEVSVRDVRNMMANLPSFVKTRDTVTLNLEVALECMDAVEKQQLKTIADFEQTAALGMDVDQRKPERLTDRLVELIADPEVTPENKKRLVVIYVLYRRTGMFAKDWARLGQHAGLSRADLDMLVNLNVLGGAMVKSTQHQPVLPSQFATENPDDELLFARYVPGIKAIADQLINGTLDRAMFPFGGEEPTNTEMAVEVATSLRNPRQRATWAQNTTATKAKKTARRRVILFVVGGFTASEARSVYELAEKYPKDVILGGNEFLTPQKFMNFLGRLKYERAALNLPSDAPPRQVPHHLEASDYENKPQSKPATISHQPQYKVQPGQPSQPSQQHSRPTGGSHRPDNGRTGNNGYVPDSQTVNQGMMNISLQDQGEVTVKKQKSGMRSKLKGAFRSKK